MNNKSIKIVQDSLKSRGCILGHKIYYYKHLSSTMITAKNIANQGCEEGTVILAGTQNSGRGRLGRNWSSPEGGIWMSVVLRPPMYPLNISLITLASGVSICNVIQKYYSLTPGLKWPNDVFLNGKKLCGILTEGSIESNIVTYAVVGIGINLNFSIDLLTPELRATATTLLTETGQSIKQEEFLHHLLIEFDSVYRQLINDSTQIIELWKKYSITIGKEVYAINNGIEISGTAIDISHKGNLIIKLISGEEIEICSGEIGFKGGKYI